MSESETVTILSIWAGAVAYPTLSAGWRTVPFVPLPLSAAAALNAAAPIKAAAAAVLKIYLMSLLLMPDMIHHLAKA